ncbi:MAG: sigma-54-dependent Fis family transcriptional regulator [Candidatus Riflebacteria bacterium]|nr:sigma-54-dependent Fis family transcriptional regulator [Candidatus Riflebacteria bacterium]
MSGHVRSKILVIDDEHSVRWAFEKALQKVGYEVCLAETGTKGLSVFASWRPDLTLLDIRMPEMDGLTVLTQIREADPTAHVIVMTAYSDMETTVTAMKAGAYDCLSKPFDIGDCLALIAKGLSARAAEKNHVPAEADPVARSVGLIGNSPPMQEVYKLIGMVATEDVTVLITGESGSGKELVAQAIHYNSNRAAKPFWAINCTAISDSLMESELFGYEKGAFTGAGNSKPGVFELAQGGTLFLDELGDMNLDMQANLLRVLEEREIVRVGGNKRIKVDVRIIAATNKDLRRYIQEKRFRDDLFHRIKVIEINLPPLRERVEDIPILAKAFMTQLAPNRKGAPKSLSDGAVTSLCAYSWPGNVRELRNAIDQAYTLSRDQIILSEHLPIEVRRRHTAIVPSSQSSPPSRDADLQDRSFIPLSGTQIGESMSSPARDRKAAIANTSESDSDTGTSYPGAIPLSSGNIVGDFSNTTSASLLLPRTVLPFASKSDDLKILRKLPLPAVLQSDSAETPDKIMTRYVATRLQETDSTGQAHDRVMDAVEKELLRQALAMHKGNQVQTAHYLGITRNTLRSKIEKYDL